MDRIDPIAPDRSVQRIALTHLTPLEREREKERRERERRRRQAQTPAPATPQTAPDPGQTGPQNPSARLGARLDVRG